MPTVSRWFLRASLLYMLAALILGIVTAAGAAVESAVPWLSVLTPVQVHLWTVGWLTQLIFGVAHWLFPKHSSEHPRGHVWLMWVAFAGINGGLLLRVVAEPLATGAAAGAVGAALVGAAGLQWLGGTAFAVHAWTRVR